MSLQLCPLFCSNNKSHYLGKLIVTMYVIPMDTYALTARVYLTKSHKRKLQSLLDRGLRQTHEAHHLTSNLTIHTASVCSLNATTYTSHKFCYCTHFHGNPLISVLCQHLCKVNIRPILGKQPH